MEITNATEDDLPAIVAIYNAAIPGRMATADLAPVSISDRLVWFRAHDAVKYPIWIATLEGCTVAWLSLQPFYGRAAYAETAEISIYVASNYQGRGIGRKLLNFAIQTGPELSISTLLGFIFGHNQPSIALFSSLGFTCWGELPQIAELDGIKRNLLILGRRIRQPI